MKRLSILVLAAAVVAFGAPAALGCGGEKARSVRPAFETGLLEEKGALVRPIGDDFGDRFVGEDGKERGAGGFESHARGDFDREKARIAHDLR